MKVAVYLITKNEELFIDRCFESLIHEADEICIVDTGSTDRTLAVLSKWENLLPDVVHVHQISVSPWRFDMARNASLALVSADADVCVCLDLDEVMIEGWRTGIERAWTPETTRLRYNYVWNWTADGKPDVTYYADKIHSRKGYRWIHPVHEVLQPYLSSELQTWTHDVKIHHHADNSKSRFSYLPLLALACEEDPHCDRNAYYYGRELVFRGLYIPALDELARHRDLPRAKWDLERCASWRFSAKALTALGRHDEAQEAIDGAILEAPHIRERDHKRGDVRIGHSALLQARSVELTMRISPVKFQKFRPL